MQHRRFVCRHRNCNRKNKDWRDRHGLREHECSSRGHCVNDPNCPACHDLESERTGRAVSTEFRCRHAVCQSDGFSKQPSRSRHETDMGLHRDCPEGCKRCVQVAGLEKNRYTVELERRWKRNKSDNLLPTHVPLVRFSALEEGGNVALASDFAHQAYEGRAKELEKMCLEDDWEHRLRQNSRTSPGLNLGHETNLDLHSDCLEGFQRYIEVASLEKNRYAAAARSRSRPTHHVPDNPSKVILVRGREAKRKCATIEECGADDEVLINPPAARKHQRTDENDVPFIVNPQQRASRGLFEQGANAANGGCLEVLQANDVQWDEETPVNAVQRGYSRSLPISIEQLVSCDEDLAACYEEVAELRALQYLCTGDELSYKRDMTVACLHGRFVRLEWLIVIKESLNSAGFAKATIEGDMAALQRHNRANTHGMDWERMAFLAALGGQLPILQWIHSMVADGSAFRTWDVVALMSIVYRQEDDAMFNWMKEYLGFVVGRKDMTRLRMLKKADESRYTDLRSARDYNGGMRGLYRRLGIAVQYGDCDAIGCLLSDLGGGVRLLQNPYLLHYAVSATCTEGDDDGTHAATTATTHTNLNAYQMVEWLRGRFVCMWEAKVLRTAATQGKWSLVEHLIASGCPGDSSLCTLAAEQGQWAVVERLRMQGLPWDADTCKEAARKGQWDMVEYFVKNGCSCHKQTCSIAAEQCKWERVKWLVKNGCPCDASTLETAAKKGKWDMVKWLVRKGQMCDKETFHEAAREYQWEMVKWLKENGCPCDSYTLRIIAHSCADMTARLNARARDMYFPERAQEEHLKVLKWACVNGCAGDARKCAFAGWETLKWLVEHHPCAPEVRHDKNAAYDWECITREAASKGQWEIVKAIVTHGQPCGAEACSAAALRGGWDMVKWLVDQQCPCDAWTSCWAAEKGEWGMVEWLREKGCPWDDHTLNNAAKRGEWDKVEWLIEKGCPWNAYTCRIAAERSEWSKVKWLRERGCPWDSTTARAAAEQGNHKILKWLQDSECPWNESLPLAAAQKGKWDTVQWLLQHECPCDARTCKTAALNGEWGEVKWLLEHRCPWSADICTAVIAKGEREAVNWLVTIECPCDPSTIREAAKKGEWALVIWLRDHGCPWDAATCSEAAERGEWEMVRWLLENGCPCDEKTCTAAAHRHDWEMVKWFVENGHPCDSSPCKAAAWAGEWDLVKWLVEKGCDSDYVCWAAMCKGEWSMVKWLVENGCPCDDYTSKKAAERGEWEIVNMLRHL